MTVQRAYKILAFIIQEWEKGNPVTIEDLIKWQGEILKEKLEYEEKERMSPYFEVWHNLNLLGQCVVNNKDKFIPTEQGLFDYVDMKERFDLPNIDFIIKITVR